MLLAELMRIKAEGDYDAIKALVDKYGVHFDPKLRDQVVARYKTLDLPTYWAGINSRLEAGFDENGTVSSVAINYPRDPVRQYLRYGAMYDKGLGGQNAVRSVTSSRSGSGQKNQHASRVRPARRPRTTGFPCSGGGSKR